MAADVGRSLLQALGAECAAGAAVATRLEAGISFLDAGDPLGGFAPAAIRRVANDFVSRGWIRTSGRGWQRTGAALPVGLSAFLAGAAAMRGIAIEETEAVAVVTLPDGASRIAEALPKEGPVHATMEGTGREIERVARAAVGSLTLMSPFVNREGAEFAMHVFDLSDARQKTLITRLAGSTGRSVSPLLGQMAQRRIRVLSYLVSADGGYETFHAKVVLADGDLAYVGSANLTMYDRHSMELGLVVKGRAARAVAAVVRSVERIAQPVSGA